ncbi:MAG TPA: SGNH/GDSL hydrolase family protein, partial [Bradyrhizobium sp.]
YPLPHFRAAIKSRHKVKVVAIGSSSTAGADGILPFLPRLEMLLRQNFYGSMIDVLNRGIGGQEALDEVSRFECDVIDEAPALVIWQVGTNAVFTIPVTVVTMWPRRLRPGCDGSPACRWMWC